MRKQRGVGGKTQLEDSRRGSHRSAHATSYNIGHMPHRDWLERGPSALTYNQSACVACTPHLGTCKVLFLIRCGYCFVITQSQSKVHVASGVLRSDVGFLRLGGVPSGC